MKMILKKLSIFFSHHFTIAKKTRRRYLEHNQLCYIYILGLVFGERTLAGGGCLWAAFTALFFIILYGVHFHIEHMAFSERALLCCIGQRIFSRLYCLVTLLHRMFLEICKMRKENIGQISPVRSYRPPLFFRE